MRAAHKIGSDLTRNLRRVVRLEAELQAAHGDGDWDEAWKKAIELKASISKTDFLRAAYEKAAGL